MLIVLRGLDSAEQGRAMSLDDAPGGLAASSVPLWRPHGATGLFDGLPGRTRTNAASGAGIGIRCSAGTKER